MALLTPISLPAESVYPVTRWSLHQDISLDPPTELIDSVKHFGLLRPLIVKKRSARYDLICGNLRYEALGNRYKGSNVPCLVVAENIKEHHLLRIVAEDQKATAPLSPIETARLIQLFSQCQSVPDEALLQSATSIGAAGQRTRLLTLLSLEKPILTAIHHGLISVKTGIVFVSLPAEERLFLFELCTRFSLNANKQRRLIEMGNIIAASERCSLKEFIAQNYPELFQDSPDNVPQAANKLMSELFKRSHPGISGAQKEFQERAAMLSLPKNCSLSPSPAFEHDSVKFSAEFKDLKDFEKVWRKIARYF